MKAKKISSGSYQYKGYLIELVDESGYRSWNIFNASGEVVDAGDRLRDAKHLIDQLTN